LNVIGADPDPVGTWYRRVELVEAIGWATEIVRFGVPLDGDDVETELVIVWGCASARTGG
jgi:hypothetical protein